MTPHVLLKLPERSFAFHKSLHVPVLQHAPTNKLLYARDIPMFKQEVKAYYRQVRDQQSVTACEFKDFLLEESKVTSVSAQHSRRNRQPEISG